MSLPTDPTIYLVPLAIVTLLASLWQIHQNETDLDKKKKEIDQRMYETLILREIGERIGYELNIGKILDTITGSLNKLLSYSAVSYMLIDGSGAAVNFQIHLEESVNRKFLETVRNHMLEGLNKVAPHFFSTADLRETVSGTIIDEAVNDPVSSLWVMPLTINSRGLGVMAIASKKNGLYRGPEMEVLVKILAQANRAVNNLEKIVASQEENLNAMVSSMTDGVLMLDKKLGLMVINPAAVTLLGLPPEAKVTIFDIARILADKVDLRSKIEESNRENKVVVVDSLVVGEKMSQLFISPVSDHGQNRVGTVVLFHDITVQKELERVREEFTAMMVHELRAPLTVVSGATDMFRRNPALSGEPQGQELLRTMQNSASSMLSLVNDLLDIAKIEAGKFQIVKTRGDLAEIIRDRTIFFAQLASPKSITLSAEIGEADLTAEFDRDRISQVFNNLLSNAIKFTPVGGKITVSAEKINSPNDIKWRYGAVQSINITNPVILVAVSDTGKGIASEKISDLFSKFKQLHPTEGEMGTGLGLVIAKGIVESHGGTIFVESKVDQGTTFYFTVPVVPPPAESSPGANSGA